MRKRITLSVIAANKDNIIQCLESTRIKQNEFLGLVMLLSEFFCLSLSLTVFKSESPNLYEVLIINFKNTLATKKTTRH